MKTKLEKEKNQNQKQELPTTNLGGIIQTTMLL